MVAAGHRTLGDRRPRRATQLGRSLMLLCRNRRYHRCVSDVLPAPDEALRRPAIRVDHTYACPLRCASCVPDPPFAKVRSPRGRVVPGPARPCTTRSPCRLLFGRSRPRLETMNMIMSMTMPHLLFPSSPCNARQQEDTKTRRCEEAPGETVTRQDRQALLRSHCPQSCPSRSYPPNCALCTRIAQLCTGVATTKGSLSVIAGI